MDGLPSNDINYSHEKLKGRPEKYSFCLGFPRMGHNFRRLNIIRRKEREEYSIQNEPKQGYTCSNQL